MSDDRKQIRRREIEDVAYKVLAERGFTSTSMLEIAKQARASNETLYQWYGDKLGLFAAMIEANRAAAVRRLQMSIEGASLADDLLAFGTALLDTILSDRAILLNRAAAADASGQLGRTLSVHGRDAVIPHLKRRLEKEPLPSEFSDHGDAAECFIALLIGDRQIRRVLGALPEPDMNTCKVWAARAVRRFLVLLTARGAD
jgi:AcrR family transcriptional regulator